MRVPDGDSHWPTTLALVGLIVIVVAFATAHFFGILGLLFVVLFLGATIWITMLTRNYRKNRKQGMSVMLSLLGAVILTNLQWENQS